MDAVIDIGSNSVRLMLDEGKIINDKKINSTALGEGLAHTGTLCDAAMDRTTAAVKAYVDEARARGADNIYVFGTEAMRAAQNGETFRLRLERECALPVKVISGNSEARIGLMGAADEIIDEVTVIDIGGASVEIVRGDAHRITYSASAPLGMVRLLDIVGSDRKAIEKYVNDNITQFGFVSGWEGIAIGGTATSLAAMDLLQRTYDAQKVHCHVLYRNGLTRLTDEIFSSTDLLADYPTLSPRRARVIGHGAIMLNTLLDYLGLDCVTVSERDNMEGYLKAVRMGITL